jgi:homoserine O-succinyltransferase
MDESRAHKQEIRPLKICVLNLMPLKITTETDLVRLLSNTPLQLEVYFMKLKSHTPKNTPIEHMMMFYKDFQELSKQKFDGMIVTGAPIETMAYEEVEYWPEIKEIFDWARTHVTSTLYICWGAQAGLYHFYGVPKHLRGQGIGKILVEKTFEYLHNHKIKGIAVCSYIKAIVDRSEKLKKIS